jgi:hypothetical protein
MIVSIPMTLIFLVWVLEIISFWNVDKRTKRYLDAHNKYL